MPASALCHAELDSARSKQTPLTGRPSRQSTMVYKPFRLPLIQQGPPERGQGPTAARVPSTTGPEPPTKKPRLPDSHDSSDQDARTGTDIVQRKPLHQVRKSESPLNSNSSSTPKSHDAAASTTGDNSSNQVNETGSEEYYSALWYVMDAAFRF